MVHHRQRLPLGLEAGDDLLGVHAVLDDLQRDLPLDRLGLLGQVDDAHAALAELAYDRVGADAGAGFQPVAASLLAGFRGGFLASGRGLQCQTQQAGWAVRAAGFERSSALWATCLGQNVCLPAPSLAFQVSLG